MSFVQPVTFESLVVNGRHYMPRNRPTILLACLCFLRLYTTWSFDEIGIVLHDNFPELLGSYDSEARAQLVRRLWDYTLNHRPYWFQGMHESLREDEVWELLRTLQRQLFRCSCMFPAGWRDGQPGEVDVWLYLRDLMSLQWQ